MKAMTLAAVAAGLAQVAQADFEINIDPGAQPIRDARRSTCSPLVGYAGSGVTIAKGGGSEEYWFVTNRVEMARAMKEAGAWFQRVWGANQWFAHRAPNPYPADSDDKEIQKKRKAYRQSSPEAAFRFWKENGFKVLFTLETWGGEKSRNEILEFVRWIVDNNYKDVVAGFELGNESYYSPKYPNLAPEWTLIVNEIWKIWPKVPLGINLCELFEENPDIEQVRGRMLAAGTIKRDGYFSACDFNRYSAQFVTGMSNCIKRISHVIYHAYGGETPYSCSYYGFRRFRNFCESFPELKGKKMWLSEVRLRSGEDMRCQRIFRESLVMSHYALTAICQPDMDGFNHHQLYALSGGLYQSSGSSWALQWRDAGQEYPDYRSVGRPHLDVGSMGVAYRIITEAIKGHPIILAHGTSKDRDSEDTFFTSARVMDQVYARRRALKEGKNAPPVAGEVEWTVLANTKRNELCLLMVNTKGVSETVKITAPEREFAAPTYCTLSCPERFVDCREIPGEGKPWRQISWEDAQCGYATVGMEPYVGMKPSADTLTVTIDPHTVQSVTFVTRVKK